MTAPKSLRGEKVLVVGATGLVAQPIIRALAPANDVIALARFRDRSARGPLEAIGVTALPFDLAAGDFEEIPDDVTVVLNFAVDRNDGGDFDRQMATSAEATGLLMARVRTARAFLQCSSSAVYQPAGDRPVTETGDLGDHHRAQYPTYSIGRIAAEAVARTGARVFGLPTVIARLTVPYGSVWGFPSRHLRQILAGEPILLHPEDPQWFTPLHEDDLVASVAALVDNASVPTLVVNWAGDEQVQMVEWCRFIGTLVGVEPRFEASDRAFRGLRADGSRRRQLAGPASVDWQSGIGAMVEAAGRTTG
ncbi:MAG TPA: NAD(P)-dependent oxidoreductase [Acidimicrobiales bacterium]|jgi:nucleoside-diphosphate-sugar epimerase|nr:NAD(P)-dependent oxidoreductase [Acidimicrobiales bacterium]